jgi:hypothetical protein
VNVSINIIVAIAGICLIDLCYIFEIQQQLLLLLLLLLLPPLLLRGARIAQSI